MSSHGVPAFGRVFIIMMENTSQTDIQGSSSAPYINGLMGQYAYTTNYSTSYHPSLPNYIDLTSGSNQNLSCDCQPTGTACDSTCFAGTGFCGCPVSAMHLGDQLDAVTIPWRTYGEGMGTPCNQSSTGNYVPRHLPFTYYADMQANSNAKCIEHVRDYAADFATDFMAGTYRFNMISPDLCDDMHGNTGCPGTPEITQGDTWLSTNAKAIIDKLGPTDVLFIVWDEQTGSTGTSPMLNIIVSPLVKPMSKSTQAYTHESLLATIEDSFGLARLANAATVPSLINDVWK